MSFFEERILEVLKGGRPRDFKRIQWEVEFSHSTLRFHLRRLVEHNLIIKEKTPLKELERPKFTYSMSPRVKRQVSHLLSDDYVEIVSLMFN